MKIMSLRPASLRVSPWLLQPKRNLKGIRSQETSGFQVMELPMLNQDGTNSLSQVIFSALHGRSDYDSVCLSVSSAKRQSGDKQPQQDSRTHLGCQRFLEVSHGAVEQGISVCFLNLYPAFLPYIGFSRQLTSKSTTKNTKHYNNFFFINCIK